MSRFFVVDHQYDDYEDLFSNETMSQIEDDESKHEIGK